MQDEIGKDIRDQKEEEDDELKQGVLKFTYPEIETWIPGNDEDEEIQEGCKEIDGIWNMLDFPELIVIHEKGKQDDDAGTSVTYERIKYLWIL